MVDYIKLPFSFTSPHFPPFVGYLYQIVVSLRSLERGPSYFIQAPCTKIVLYNYFITIILIVITQTIENT